MALVIVSVRTAWNQHEFLYAPLRESTQIRKEGFDAWNKISRKQRQRVKGDGYQ